MSHPHSPYFIGDSCICWSFGEEIDISLSERVIAAYRFLKDSKVDRVLDIVPSYNALAVYFDPTVADSEELIRTISGLLEKSGSLPPPGESATHYIPVIYDGEDLPGLAERKGLTIGEIARIHSGAVYTVAMIGFRPHFPYLLGMDPRLETPRLESPRSRVPAGSVGIGGKQTGIYPEESPGGWNLIGHTNPFLLSAVRVGDIIRFRSVSEL